MKRPPTPKLKGKVPKYWADKFRLLKKGMPELVALKCRNGLGRRHDFNEIHWDDVTLWESQP